ncbi:MAG: glycine cleavage system aminomethyltransferase GcvT [Syntrophaceticus schinkii]|jgi:aminomethyltransferase|nr:glycine cleavage system aminomethyltransferase GcvT [Syntrophaceticus schinkii]
MGLQRTPLFPMHQKYKGKLIDFGGWELPVEYQGIISEHKMVRSKAGMFDVSHMGEVEVTGERSLEYLNNLLTNDFTDMAVGQIRYSPMCYEHGGVVDDLMVCKFSPTHYFLVINAANTKKDLAWMQEQAFSQGVTITDVSDSFAEIALQGPLAQEILQPLCDADLAAIKYYYFLPHVQVSGVDCLLSRTGYTGEDGFEIYMPPEDACTIWEAILQEGGDRLALCGLGARDTLRLEARLPLYGHEMDEDITPLEAGFGRFVKLEKPSFIGKEALAEQKEKGLERKLVEFEMLGRGIPRPGYEVQKDGTEIGHVTSGGYLPTLEKNLGLCLIKSEFALIDNEIEIMIRKKAVKARTGKGLFYRRGKK